jgi:hypothetical protein
VEACRFYAAYFILVFRGGRKHWETVAFWIVAVVVVLSAINPDALPRLLATWGLTSPEGLGIVPFYTVMAYIACRAALAPLWLYRDSVSAGRKRLARESAKLGNDEDTSGRDKFVVLAGQLRHFLSAQNADYDSQFDRDLLETAADDFQDRLDSAVGDGRVPGKRARKRTAMQRSHNDSTLREYGERFFGRVVAASRDLRELGTSNATTTRLDKYPTTIPDIEAIVGELEAASASIPSPAMTEVASLRSDVAELQAISGQRHLDEDKQRVIAQVVRTGLRDLWELHRASPSWTADDKEEPIFIRLYTMENDRETILYRADFVKAFEAGGLGVSLGEFIGTSGDPANEQFVGTVSLVRSPQNLVRPFVLDALQSAHISVNECEDWPRSETAFDHARGFNSSAVTLIIGQRR